MLPEEVAVPCIHPSPQALQHFFALPDDGPLVMINLLKFGIRADYQLGSGGIPCSGREAYQRYAGAVLPLVRAAGGELVLMGEVRATLIAPEGESWDAAALVRYPSKAAFVGMTTSEEYAAVAFHRTAALEDSRLIALLPGQGV